MEKPVINSFSAIAPLVIQKYESYLPTAYDESLSILQKMNLIINKLAELGVATNGVVEQWNKVMEWVMTDGLTADINRKLDEMVADGTMDTIINHNIFNDLNTRIGTVEDNVDTRFTEIEADIASDFATMRTDVDNDIDTRFGDINQWREHYKVISNVGTVSEVTARLQEALSNTDGFSWIVLEGEYNVNQNLMGRVANIISRNATLKFSNAGEGLTFKGTKKFDKIATAGYTQGRSYLLMPDTTGINVGDLMNFGSTNETYNPSRSYYTKGSTVVVTKVDADRVWFAGGLPYSINVVNKVEIYNPAKVRIEGQLKIQNTGALPNGSNGLMIMFAKDSYVQGVTADNYDTCISITRCTGFKGENLRTLKAYYANTPQSYGIIIASSNNVSLENCETQSGRHGLATGGWEPNDNIHLKNCKFFGEPSSGSRSLDMHNNMIHAILENVECDTFQISGIVKAINLTVHNRELTQSLIAQSDEYWKASYDFDGLTLLNGGSIDLGAYAQSGGSIDNMNKVNSVAVRNARGDLPFHLRLNARGFGGSGVATVRGVLMENTINMGLIFSDHIDGLTMKNAILEGDETFIVQTADDCVLKRATIMSCTFPARYLAFQIKEARKITLISCQDISVGSTAPRFQIAGPNTQITFINSSFNNLTEGIDMSVLSYTLIDTTFNIYGTPEGTRKELL